jgi:hypothetical protein
MTINTQTPEKWYQKKTFLIIAAVLFVLLIATIFTDEEKENKTETADKTSSQPVEAEGKHIPGILPYDVWGNFKDKGFVSEKSINTNGSYWTNYLDENGIRYDVRTYCENGVNHVDNVRLSATINTADKNTDALKAFLKFGCSIPFDGNDPQKIADFIDNNYNNDKASIIISNVKFTIYAPTKFARMIEIESN